MVGKQKNQRFGIMVTTNANTAQSTVGATLLINKLCINFPVSCTSTIINTYIEKTLWKKIIVPVNIYCLIRIVRVHPMQ